MITVVSGLPRSGTSLMMQMLAAGGMDLLADVGRRADDNNPRGYYEYEKVKMLGKDRSWLRLAEGKAVKIITQLLPNLLPGHEYAVIYMVRPVEEVLKSQAAMLDKLGKQGAVLSPEVLATAYARQVKRIQNWFTRNPKIKVQYVLYQEVLSNPGEQASAVNDFLKTALNTDAMAAVVDTSLWRQRLEAF